MGKQHNDAVRKEMRRLGMDPASFGWASCQLDGGISSVEAKIFEYFFPSDAERKEAKEKRAEARAGISSTLPRSGLVLGVVGFGTCWFGRRMATTAASLVRTCVSFGTTVIVPNCGFLTKDAGFLDDLLESGKDARPSLAFGERPDSS